MMPMPRTTKPSPPKRHKGTRISDYANLLESIRGLAGSLRALNQQAVREYTPAVETILRSRSRDARRIERTLDGLLDFCGYEPALQLYKNLCRYYFPINPAVTAEYIHAYREMWDSEEKKEQPTKAEASGAGGTRNRPRFAPLASRDVAGGRRHYANSQHVR
jgi:hypothetical protein